MTKLPSIGKPATRALSDVGITTLEQVSKLDENNLSKMHGVGPKAIRILKEAMAEEGLSFSELDDELKKLKFTVIGDLKCDNAPKRRIIRDVLIASTTGDEKVINEWLTEDFVWVVPGEMEIEGKDAFIKEIKEHLQAVSSLEIRSLLSHGKEGASHGTVTNNRGGKIHFADMYEFENNKKEARIKKITSYVTMKP